MIMANRFGKENVTVFIIGSWHHCEMRDFWNLVLKQNKKKKNERKKTAAFADDPFFFHYAARIIIDRSWSAFARVRRLTGK